METLKQKGNNRKENIMPYICTFYMLSCNNLKLPCNYGKNYYMLLFIDFFIAKGEITTLYAYKNKVEYKR